MIRFSEISLPPEAGQDALRSACARLLGCPEKTIRELRILRRAVDSRRKPEVRFVYTVAVTADKEAKLLQKNKNPRIALYAPEEYVFPAPKRSPALPPVVVGMGPAGLFAALSLAEAGIPVTVLERGRPAEIRRRDVAAFWNGGPLDPVSNVQFGEGGAGIFSDGKLNTGTGDRRIGYVLRRLTGFGAPEDILWEAAPHVGTDRLVGVVTAVRQRLLELGCTLLFETKLTGLDVREGRLRGIEVTDKSGPRRMETEHLILAPGNGARDTFAMLAAAGVPMEAKAFSVGVRLEHRQADVDLAQYGQAATLGTLPAAGYKLAEHLDSGRSVYTFCVCPGGKVVAAASEPGGVVTNGMSDYARDGENINGGLLVSVTPDDWQGTLGGIGFQRQLEGAAFRAGGEDYFAPAQLVGDFLAKRPSQGPGKVLPTYRPGVRWCNLWEVLPEFVCISLAEALPRMDRKVCGFAHPEAVMTAVETRSSCPVRILRDKEGQSPLRGLFPCGEGAGYAGGITSAAVDGLRAAEAVVQSL